MMHQVSHSSSIRLITLSHLMVSAMAAATAFTTLPAAAYPGIDGVRFRDVRTVHYRCDADRTLTVRYLNGTDNSAAILRISGNPLLFVNVISASGVRYVAGQYEWLTKGDEGSLRNLELDQNATPVYAGCRMVKSSR